MLNQENKATGIFQQEMLKLYWQISIQKLFGCDNKVGMTGHYTGTWKSNGKKFKTNAVHIWTVEDGKLVHFF